MKLPVEKITISINPLTLPKQIRGFIKLIKKIKNKRRKKL